MTNATGINQMMIRLSEARHERKQTAASGRRRVNDILTPEQVDAVARIEDETDNALFELDDEIKTLEKRLRNAVVDFGQSVQGDDMKVMIVTPAAIWDAKMLEGYAMAHEELYAFRSKPKQYARIKYDS